MASLLPNLLFDLKQRCTYLSATLGGLSGLPGPVDAYRQRMATLLQRAYTSIEQLSLDPTLLLPGYARQHLSTYKRLAELTSAMEWGPVAALRRFSSPDDAMMALMTERVCCEIAYPFTPPLCVASGFGHYCTNPGLDLVLAPASEPFHLLGISDLYHELGHVILLRKKADLEDPFIAQIDAHFAAEIKRAKQNNQAPAFVAKLKQLQSSWKSWLIEFSADMIATYLTGPTYGWANVRLCMNTHEDVYQATPSHPADAARTAAIEMMLDYMGVAQDAATIRQFWNDFVGLMGKTVPPQFGIEFPDSLLCQLRDFLFQGCTQLGLVPFDKQPVSGPGKNITRLLGEAWTRFNQDPVSFATWESLQVATIRKELGI